MVSPEGQVKILDFGLAKAWVDELSDVDLTHSPTITAEMTASGVLLGTAAYMSPEQARGKRVDKRADIWSFGVVLYEMLTGLRPFSAQTAGETIGNVLHKGIDFQRLPPLPLNIRRALRRCLERNLERRYRDIGDVRIELEQSGDDESSVEPVNHKPRRPWLWTAIVTVLLAAAAVLGWTIRGYKTATIIPLLEAEISLPAGHRLSAFSQPSFSLSPDGRQWRFSQGPSRTTGGGTPRRSRPNFCCGAWSRIRPCQSPESAVAHRRHSPLMDSGSPIFRMRCTRCQ